jgi:hypothetical protein
MPIDQQQVQNYIQNVLKTSESDPKSLSKEELRIATKYRQESQRLNQVQQDVSQMRDQIRQAEARLRSLELQAADIQGRATGLLDYLASSKFEEDIVPPAGNGVPSESAPPVPPTPAKRKGPVPGMRRGPTTPPLPETAKASEA